MPNPAIQRFRIAVPDDALADLHRRLDDTRWADPLPGPEWARGVPVAYLRALADDWRHRFDWRAHERRLNALPQFVTSIDGQTFHFVHVRSPERDALPLMLLHGWPGSFAEFAEVVAPLADPRAHGGDARDAFHVVIPSMPGCPLSTPLVGAGWTNARIAAAYASLMGRLGYARYGVQGGDAGANQAPIVARTAPDRVVGVHVNALVTFPSGDPTEMEGLDEAEQERLSRLQHFQHEQMGFVHLQGTRPQTIAFALADSPVGQLAWIAEKFREWTDPAIAFGADEASRDALLTNVSLYWFDNAGGPSANLYYESMHDPAAWAPGPRGTVPTAVLVSRSRDVAVRRLAEREHHVVRWTELERGGHFAALEAPHAFVDDVRRFFGELR